MANILGNKLVINGDGKHDDSQKRHNTTGVNILRKDTEDFLVPSSKTDSFDGYKDIGLDDLIKQRNRSHSNSKSRNDSNGALANEIDSNGNIIKEANSTKGMSKKKNGKTSKQRSKSFHIKCDRTYTNYYKIEYKGDANGNKDTKSSHSKGDSNHSNVNKPPSRVDFDCSEEYFVDDEDEHQIHSDIINTHMMSNQMKRASSLEPSDYNPTVISTKPEQSLYSKVGVEPNSYNDFDRLKKCNNEDFDGMNVNHTVRNRNYAVPNQPSNVYRPSIQR